MALADTFRRAKIVCTVGPSSRDPEVLRELIQAGADAVRVNFSHASHADAEAVAERTRRISRELERPVAVVADLQGPKIRVGELDETMSIVEGETYFFVPEEALPGAVPEGTDPGRVVPVTYSRIARDVSPGDRILLDDGRLQLRIRNVRGDVVEAEAVSTGPLESQKGINLPGVTVGAPSLTEKDREDLRLALGLEADCVALSFVRRSSRTNHTTGRTCGRRRATGPCSSPRSRRTRRSTTWRRSSAAATP